MPNTPTTVPRWAIWWLLFVGAILIGVVSFGVVRTINLVDDLRVITHQSQETNILVKQCVIDGNCGPASNRTATAKLIAGINARLDCLAGPPTVESYTACVNVKLAQIEKQYADTPPPITTSTTTPPPSSTSSSLSSSTTTTFGG